MSTEPVKPSLENTTHVHFVGVGGIGVSALARLFLQEGKKVSGSDRAPSDITSALEAEGVTFFPSQVGENITGDIDLVVYTEAMPHDHEELVAAREKGIVCINYFTALGMVANEYYLIAIAGSHGKTTTTAMLIDIFEDAGLDPSAVVGSLRARTKSNYRAGKSKYFIAEACEYKRDFLSLNPDMLIITNIEYEHVDYYKDLADVQSAFRELALRVPEDGYVVVNRNDENVLPVIEGLAATVIDYQKSMSPLRVLKVPGMHNQMNAAAAIAAAAQVGIRPEDAERSVKAFSGTWRRFEYKGEVQGAKVYDDYGHHPTEVAVTIKGARELYPDRKLVLVFQSHTYTRTATLFDDFVHALLLADEVFILPIYAAREENVHGVSHTQMVDAVNAAGGSAYACTTADEVVTRLKNEATDHDLILVMGAGDVTQVATQLMV